MDESAWVERARQGDRDAFDRLVQEHLDRAWRIAFRIVRHEQDAFDVTQEAFLTAWRSLPQFRGEASFSSWLHRIVTSRALNHLEWRAVKESRRAVSIDADPENETGAAPIPVKDPGATPLQQLEQAELMRRLKRCLEQLPAAFRAVLTLREGEQMEYEQIAKTLELALGTVRSRLARAREALLECVQAA